MKDIMLKIIGKQILNDSGEEERMEFVTEGRYDVRDGSVYLSYDESDFSGMEGCVTSLVITGDRVEMIRTGEGYIGETEMEFEKGKRFKSHYETPFGSVEMEVLTNEVINNLHESEPKGSLAIDYHVSLRGLSEGRSLLNIEIM
ncbi:MAG: DUF1934 domain-containing protein [Anaerovoracaceae bacterium]|jgi:uncharacterized beta-barrel protein YwiB (DUF1934 family)